MKALLGTFNQEKALVGAFYVIEQPVVELMDRFAALVPSLTLTRELCIFRLDGGPLRVRLPVTTHNTNYISSSQLPPSPLSDSGEEIHKLFILQNTEYLQNTQNVL